jgi:hypothetical protein
VKGYWNYNVNSQAFAPRNFGQSPGEPPTQGFDALKFEQYNRPHQPRFV